MGLQGVSVPRRGILPRPLRAPLALRLGSSARRRPTRLSIRVFGRGPAGPFFPLTAPSPTSSTSRPYNTKPFAAMKQFEISGAPVGVASIALLVLILSLIL